MADNTDEEHLESPTNTQPDTTSDDIIPTQDTETIKPIQETENMEVHHHAHHEGKKNWKSYLWEFLMLFLAVFCGFLAEYQLEHVIEHQREKQYMQSLINDLKADTTTFSKTIKNYTRITKAIDTILTCLKSDNPDPSIINDMLSRDF